MRQLKARPSYSVRPMRPQRKFTTRLGLLTPFLHEQVVTGDIIKLSEVILAKTEAMLAPLQHDLVMKTYYAFIPNRLIMKDWKEFRTGNSLVENGTYGQNKTTGEFTLHPMRDLYGIGTIPSTVFDNNILSWDYTNNHAQLNFGTININSSISGDVTFNVQFDALSTLIPQPDIHSLGDYFQLPQFPFTQLLNKVSARSYDFGFGADRAHYENAPNMSWFFDYWLFWNEFFRDPDLQDPVPLCAPKDTSDEELHNYDYLANERVSAVSGESDAQYSKYYRALWQFAIDHSTDDITASGSIRLNLSGGTNVTNFSDLITELKGMGLGSRVSHGKINPAYPAFVNYERDYFLGARPFDIRGVEPLLPLGDIAVSVDGFNVDSTFHGTAQNILAHVPGSDFTFTGSQMTPVVNNAYGITEGESLGPLYLDSARTTTTTVDGHSILTNENGETVTDNFIELRPEGPDWRNIPAGTIGGDSYVTMSVTPSGTISNVVTGTGTGAGSLGLNLNELKLALRLQNYLTRLAFTGERYQDYLLSLFGVAPSNGELQRPYFIGGSRSPVLVQEVTQTSPYSDSFLGDLAGKAHGLHVGKIGTVRANEDGFLLGCFVCYPRLEWNPQGVDKKYLHRNRYDYFNQMFDKIPPQPIETRELYLRPKDKMDGEAGAKTFGYRQAWDFLRHYQNKSVAGFRDEFDYWTLARKLDTEPALNGRFIQCDCARDNLSRPFSVQTGDTIKVFSQTNMVIYRQISNNSIPVV